MRWTLKCFPTSLRCCSIRPWRSPPSIYSNLWELVTLQSSSSSSLPKVSTPSKQRSAQHQRGFLRSWPCAQWHWTARHKNAFYAFCLTEVAGNMRVAQLLKAHVARHVEKGVKKNTQILSELNYLRKHLNAIPCFQKNKGQYRTVNVQTRTVLQQAGLSKSCLVPLERPICGKTRACSTGNTSSSEYTLTIPRPRQAGGPAMLDPQFPHVLGNHVLVMESPVTN